jgi:hypothetical protein
MFASSFSFLTKKSYVCDISFPPTCIEMKYEYEYACVSEYWKRDFNLLGKENAFFLVLKDKIDNLLQIWMHRWRVWERFVILSKKWFYLTHITCSYLFKAMLTHNLCITRISHAYVFLLFVTYNLIHFAGEQGWKRENSLGQCFSF